MSAPPTPPAGAPSSAPSPGSAAASPPLRIDTEESWNRANAWLGSKDSATSPVASEVKRLLNLAFSRWEQPGAAAPLVVEACRLAGLDPVPGDEIVARPAPTPPTPIPLGQPVPAAPASPTPTPTAPPAQPAPTPALRPLPKGAQNAPSLWRRLIVAGAIVAGATGVGLAGSVVGAISVGLAAVGGLGGLGVASAVVAIRRGGLAGIAAAVGLVVATGVGVAVVVGGHVHATGGGVAALLAGAGIAALLAGGDELVAAMRMAADKSGTQRPQR